MSKEKRFGAHPFVASRDWICLPGSARPPCLCEEREPLHRVRLRIPHGSLPLGKRVLAAWVN
jgi:hypothetical protein